jgi:EAL domain-containing protein (putative c-di-GMP-specific phosphodiesterase class I)
VSRGPVEFGDDLAAAPSTPRTAATWHVRKPIALGEMILGQLLRKSAMRCWRPVTVHTIFVNIFMPTTVHIPDPFLKSVDRRAKALGISRNRLVVRALEQAVSVRTDWSPEFLQRLRTVDRETSTAVDDLLAAVTKARRSKEPRDL